MAEFVAVSVIRHGNKDGSVTELQPGEDVTRGKFDAETLESLYASGSITVKGSTDDPNTWEGSFAAGQTPATIEANLRDLARTLDGPGSPKSTIEGELHPAALLDPGHKDSTARGVETDGEKNAASGSNPASVLFPPEEAEDDQGQAEEPATTPATPTGTTSPSKEAQKDDAKAGKS